MAMTSEKRSTYPLCGAKKKNGEMCRAFAGQSTDHLGIGRCKYHGGSTPSHRSNAVKQEAQRQMSVMGDPIEVTPGQALQSVLNLSAGALVWLKAMVAGLTEGDVANPEGQSLLRLYNDERERVARIAKACADAGVSEREIQLSERQTEIMGEFLEAVMDRIHLTAEQRRAVGPAIREAMPALLAGTPETVST